MVQYIPETVLIVSKNC